jgi:hypothetical protein
LGAPTTVETTFLKAKTAIEQMKLNWAQILLLFWWMVLWNYVYAFYTTILG